MKFPVFTSSNTGRRVAINPFQVTNVIDRGHATAIYSVNDSGENSNGIEVDMDFDNVLSALAEALSE